jgi:hypothetical protein
MQYYYAVTVLLVISTQCLQVVRNDGSSRDIDLHTADFSLDYQNSSKMYAYGRFGNRLIIDDQEKDKYGQLEWFSYGVPRMMYHKQSYLKIKDDNCSLFQMTSRGFTILVEMLT